MRPRAVRGGGGGGGACSALVGLLAPKGLSLQELFATGLQNYRGLGPFQGIVLVILSRSGCIQGCRCLRANRVSALQLVQWHVLLDSTRVSNIGSL